MAVGTGHINASELVPNRDRRFGQGTHFNHVTLLQAGQPPRSLLFSNDQIQVARERAEANPEDCLAFEPEQVRIDRAVAIARSRARAVAREQVIPALRAEAKAAARCGRWVGVALGVLTVLVGSALGRLL